MISEAKFMYYINVSQPVVRKAYTTNCFLIELNIHSSNNKDNI